MSTELKTRIAAFLEDLTRAMGVPLTAVTSDSSDGFRIDLEGDGSEVLLWQRGEPLRALQHVVSTAFRRQLGDDVRVVVDCQHFRRDKDAELKQLARFLVEKARTSGVPQEIGPLNAYERRIVHLTVAELPGASSESIGDASVKTVVISAS
jgi:spoIIIJ-associated protein